MLFPAQRGARARPERAAGARALPVHSSRAPLPRAPPMARLTRQHRARATDSPRSLDGEVGQNPHGARSHRVLLVLHRPHRCAPPCPLPRVDCRRNVLRFRRTDHATSLSQASRGRSSLAMVVARPRRLRRAMGTASSTSTLRRAPTSFSIALLRPLGIEQLGGARLLHPAAWRVSWSSARACICRRVDQNPW